MVGDGVLSEGGKKWPPIGPSGGLSRGRYILACVPHPAYVADVT